MTNLLKSEFRKVITLKFWWALLIAPLLVGLGTSAFTSSVLQDTDDFNSDEIGAVAAFSGVLVAVVTVIVFAAIFGAINAGTEFAHKTITTTFLTTSSRDASIGAKLLVTAGFALVYGLVIQIVSVLVVVIFAPRDADLEFTGDVWLALLLALFVIVCWGLIGAGFGLLFGSSLAAVLVVTFGPIADLILGTIIAGAGGDNVRFWMPMLNTFGVMVAGDTDDEDIFAPWPAPLLIMVFYVVLVVGAGWLLTRRRDIT